MSRLPLFIFVCLLAAAPGLLALPATAQDAVLPTGATTAASTGATTHEAALQVPAGKFIQDLGTQAIATIADKSQTDAQRRDRFRQLLRDDFDLLTIGRFVIGRGWNSATDAQRQEYIHLFSELVVKTYGDRLNLYTGEGFVVVGVRPESEKDSVVASQITHPDGSTPTTIDWRVRQRDGRLGVIDVVVEGVSLSVTQRQEYTAIIQRGGGQIDGLLEQMRAELQSPGPAAGTAAPAAR